MTVSFSLIPSRFKRKRIECHDSLGMARADNVTLTTVEVADKSGFRRDPAESFFLERYCAAYKAELAAFVDSVTSGAARGLVQFVHDGGELAPAYSVVVSGSDETVYKTTYIVANSLIKFLRKWTKSSTIRKMEALSWLSTCAGASIWRQLKTSPKKNADRVFWMELTYLGHAGFLVESEDHALVIDPWLSSKGAFLSSWYQYPRNHDFIHELKRRVAGKYLAVYVTHEHEDHFCRDTLRELLELKPRFLAPHYAMPHFRESYQEAVGGAVLEIEDKETITLGDLKITVFIDEGGISRDSAVLVADKDGRRFLNLNDCKIYDRCAWIKRTYGEIHVLACQFTGAVMHPICYDYPEDEYRKISWRKRYSKLAGVANVIKTIKPQIYLPSAGPVAFLDPRLYHLNIEAIFPRWWEFQDFLDKKGKLGATRFVPLKVGGHLLVGAGAPDPASVARPLSTEEHREELESYRAAIEEQTGADRPRRELPADDVILRRLGEVLSAKVQPFLEMKGTLPPPVPVYFALEDASDYIKVDFAACLAKRTSKISDEKYYLHRAIREDIYAVVLGEVPWGSYWLTFRFKNVRVPDDYSTQVNLFFISNTPDEVRFGLRVLARLRLSTERITVCDPETGKTFTCVRFCPHQGADLAYARVEGAHLVCPRHYWRYHLLAGGKCDRSEDTINAVLVINPDSPFYTRGSNAGGVPEGAVEHEEGIGAGRDPAGDLTQMGLHGLGVGPGLGERRSGAGRRTNGAEEIERETLRPGPITGADRKACRSHDHAEGEIEMDSVVNLGKHPVEGE